MTEEVGINVSEKIDTLVVGQYGVKYMRNCALSAKSMKFGTDIL